jgi:pimeloyl-ACP methyl ester carboxylesterase
MTLHWFTADVHGTRVRYVREGLGPVIVLVHGIGGGPGPYDELIHLLARRYNVIVPQLCGLIPGVTTVAGHAALLDSFVSSLRAHAELLVGHSYGGAVVAHSSLPCKKLLLNPAVLGMPATRYFFTAWRINALCWAGRYGTRGIRLALRAAWPSLYAMITRPREARAILQDLEHTRSAYHHRIIWASGDPYAAAPPGSHVIEGPHDWPILKPERAAQEIDRAVRPTRAS